MDVDEAEFINDFLSKNQLSVANTQIEGVNREKLAKTRDWFNYLESKSGSSMLKTPSQFFSSYKEFNTREIAKQYEDYISELEDVYTGKQFSDFNFEKENIQQYMRWSQK